MRRQQMDAGSSGCRESLWIMGNPGVGDNEDDNHCNDEKEERKDYHDDDNLKGHAIA